MTANTPSLPQQVINFETTLKIPKQARMSNEARDLILRLLTSPERRLGKNGAKEVKEHPFFASIDFEKGVRRMRAPYIPKIRYPTDTSNFDPVDDDRLRDSDSESESEYAAQSNTTGSDDSEHPGFFEFTFRRFFDGYGPSNGAQRMVDDPVYV